MRRNWGRRVGRSSPWSLDCQLDVETLENRLALSHAPMPVDYEPIGFDPAGMDLRSAATDAYVSVANPTPLGGHDAPTMNLGGDGNLGGNGPHGLGDVSGFQPNAFHSADLTALDRPGSDVNYGYATTTSSTIQLVAIPVVIQPT